MAFKIDFSDSDKTAEGMSAVYAALPSGDYPCVVSDIELAEVKSGDNQGKLMFKVTLTVEDDAPDAKYNGRKFWPNIMLFTVYGRDGKPNNFFLAQWLKATGNDSALDTGEVPEADAFLGKKILVGVTRKRRTYGVSEGDPITYENAVKSFMPLTVDNVAKGKARKTNSLLP